MLSPAEKKNIALLNLSSQCIVFMEKCISVPHDGKKIVAFLLMRTKYFDWKKIYEHNENPRPPPPPDKKMVVALTFWSTWVSLQFSVGFVLLNLLFSVLFFVGCFVLFHLAIVCSSFDLWILITPLVSTNFSYLARFPPSLYCTIITLLLFFIEMLQYDWLWSGHMIIKEMFYIPIKLKPKLAHASITTSDVNNQWRSNFQQQII